MISNIKLYIIFVISCFVSLNLFSDPILSNLTTTTLVRADENITLYLKVSNVSQPYKVAVNYSVDGYGINWLSPAVLMYPVDGEPDKYYYTISSASNLLGEPEFQYFFKIQKDSVNYYLGSKDNPFKITVYHIDTKIPHIIHRLDNQDDEDDGNSGKFQGIAGNGIPDEDEDNLDSDPYQFRDNFTEDDTGNPWGIVTKTIKNNTVVIKAIAEEYTGAAEFDKDGKMYLYYKEYGETAYKKVSMSLIQGKIFAAEIPYYEVKSDIEYFIAAVDSSVEQSGLEYDAETGVEFLNIAICDAASFMFSGDNIDNDGDNKIDEESYNGLDDDNDGRIDEDLNNFSPILSKANGGDINKQLVITNKKNKVTVLNENQIDYYITSSLPIVPFVIKVYDNTEEVSNFNSWIPSSGTYKKDLDGNNVNYKKLFPDGTEIKVPADAFPDNYKVVISIPDTLPSLPSASRAEYTGFCRKIEVFDKFNNSISHFDNPIEIIFHRSLLSSVDDTLIIYLYNGERWISVGGQRSAIDKSQQIGFGNPMSIKTSVPGIFVIMKNPDAWGGVVPGSISELKTEPTFFTPDNDGVADTTVIKFLLASNDDPRSIGDVPLYATALMSIKIFNLKGYLVRNLCEDYEIKFEWRYGSTVQYVWDGKDDFNNLVPPGVYLIQIMVRQTSDWLTQDKYKILKKSCSVVVGR